MNTVSAKQLIDESLEYIDLSDYKEMEMLAEISAAIIKKRISMKMNQTELGKFLGVSQGQVSQWESGDYNFTISKLVKVLEKMDVDVHFKIIDRKEKRINLWNKSSKIYDSNNFKFLEDSRFSFSNKTAEVA